jgi:hypothetical protein
LLHYIDSDLTGGTTNGLPQTDFPAGRSDYIFRLCHLLCGRGFNLPERLETFI